MIGRALRALRPLRALRALRALLDAAASANCLKAHGKLRGIQLC